MRRDLLTLYAFAHEIERISGLVSEPMLGEIRLAWWRETIESIYAGTPRRHDISLALADVVARRSLPQAPFLALIEARAADLYETPMASRAALEDYLAATSGGLMQQAAIICAGPEPARAFAAGVNAAGLAYGLARLVRDLPLHASRRHLLWPAELLAAHGLPPETLFAARPTPALARFVAEIGEWIAQRRAEARASLAEAPAALAPATLPAALAPAYAKKAQQAENLFKADLNPAPLVKRWTLLRASMFGG